LPISLIWIFKYQKLTIRPDLWLDPITKEIKMLKLQDVFEVVPRPSGKNIVGSKWVFVVKWNEKGEIEKRKETVVKGYT